MVPMSDLDGIAPASPVSSEAGTLPEDGIPVCLFGGGYRAMLLRSGALWRLPELGLLRPVVHMGWPGAEVG